MNINQFLKYYIIGDIVNFSVSFILTLISGFSTMIGFLLIFFFKKSREKVIIGSLSFAAGVLIMISFSELIFDSLKFFPNNKFFYTLIFSVIGIVFSILIDKIDPNNNYNDKRLYKVGIFMIISIFIHNVLEGMMTFMTSSYNLSLGISLTIAICMHNIPEGISIAVPIYYSTCSKKKAFFWTLFSSISEPIGGLIAYFFLMPYLSNFLLGAMFSVIAGIMLYISIFELLPNSLNYNNRLLSLLFLILGIIFIIVKF